MVSPGRSRRNHARPPYLKIAPFARSLVRSFARSLVRSFARRARERRRVPLDRDDRERERNRLRRALAKIGAR
ncbi:hypothetical protein C7S16_4093 [Burkholderia thailandensis]|uniref:Uncharacterized protein n=1 Tax=Burkholderia thailandensis TaxID=57975 RepID=A0AAW9CVD7_BURTH|nr:hypothetical protein [Burkholderia thailandensis]MDW9254392.1 hypothetical protein [Burkholderia thailandensis]